jgi:hypothetical protein
MFLERTPNVSTPRDSKYRLPSQPTVMLVTPEMAGDWLDYRNASEKNRTVARTVVAKYADRMTRGEWTLTHQGIAFDTDGWVIDGQHRLLAVALAGIPQEFWVFPEQPRDTFDKLDEGRRRTGAQLLHQRNRNVLASAVRILVAQDGLETPRSENVAYAELTNTQTLQYVRHYGPDLEISARQAMGIKSRSSITPSPHTAVLYQAYQTEYAEKVAAWLEGLSSGAGLTARDSRLRLRNAFMASPATRASATRTGTITYSLIVKAWNAFAIGKEIQMLYVRNDEDVPAVIGYTPKPHE